MIFAQPRFNQFFLPVYCLVGLFAGGAKVCAHVYEDGFVERSLTITIRDGVGYGEYQIGLNEKTADQILKSAEQLKQNNVSSKLSKELQAVPSQADQLKSSTTLPLTKAVDASASANKTTESKKTKFKKLGTRTTTAPEPASSPQTPATVGSGEHLTDLAAIARFGDLRQHWFTDHLKLVSDGQTVELSEVSVEPAARHPYSLLVKFRFSLDKKKAAEGGPIVAEPSVDPESVTSTSQIVNLQVTDDVFSGNAGATRYALRARGSTMLLQSNVAPVLVRAERVEVAPKAGTAKISSPVIKARLTVGTN